MVPHGMVPKANLNPRSHEAALCRSAAESSLRGGAMEGGVEVEGLVRSDGVGWLE